jgi:Spy/CpxP family protein refolding chaperone
MNRIVRPAALALACAAIIATGVLVFAQGPPPPPQHRQGQMMGGRGGPWGSGPLQQLNLTDDQRTQIQTLMEQHRQATQSSAQKMRDLQQQLKNAVFADAPDLNTISQTESQIAALEAQLAADRVAAEKQIAGVLTADQRKQVRDMPGPGPFMGGGPGMGMGRGRGMGRGMGGPGW